MNAEELVALVRQRIESRYKRILFVQKELERLNAIAKMNSTAALSDLTQQKKQAESFEDFVFSSINFSLYKKINKDEFTLLFDKGLADYQETFFQKCFRLSREETRKTITESYVKVGPFYLCKKSSPFLLSIMRTLHTSLDFAPLLGSDDIADPDQIKAVAGILNGLVIRHEDETETKLFIPKEEEKKPGMQAEPVLCGTFHPLGKAYTIVLIP